MKHVILYICKQKSKNDLCRICAEYCTVLYRFVVGGDGGLHRQGGIDTLPLKTHLLSHINISNVT